MIRALIYFVIAFGLAACAAAFHIVGLQAIFPGINWSLLPGSEWFGWLTPIIALGIFTEAAKLAGISFIHSHWKTAPKIWTCSIGVFVVAVAILTSVGVFGFLSKGNIEHAAQTQNITFQVQTVETRIDRLEADLERDRSQLQRLDEIVQTLIDARRIRGDGGSEATLERQANERSQLNNSIQETLEKISEARQEILSLQNQQATQDNKLGPVKYMADLLGLDSEGNTALYIVIILIMLGTDPMAICLLIAAQIIWKENEERWNSRFRSWTSFFTRIRQEGREDKQKAMALKEERVQELQALVDTLKEEKDQIQEQHKTNIEKLKEQQNQDYAELEESFNSFKEEKEKEKEDLLSKIEKYNDDLASLNSMVEEKNTSVSQLNEKIQEAMDDISIKEKELQELRDKFQEEQVDTVRDELELEIQESNDTIEALNNTLEGLIKEKSELVRSFEDEINKRESEWQETFNSLNQQLEAQAQQNQIDRENIEQNYKDDLDSLKDQVQKLSKEKSEIEDKMDSLREELEAYETELKAYEDEHRAPTLSDGVDKIVEYLQDEPEFLSDLREALRIKEEGFLGKEDDIDSESIITQIHKLETADPVEAQIEKDQYVGPLTRVKPDPPK